MTVYEKRKFACYGTGIPENKADDFRMRGAVEGWFGWRNTEHYGDYYRLKRPWQNDLHHGLWLRITDVLDLAGCKDYKELILGVSCWL